MYSLLLYRNNEYAHGEFTQIWGNTTCDSTRACACACVRLGLFVSHSEKLFNYILQLLGDTLHCPFRAYSALSMVYNPLRGLQNLLGSLFLSIIFRFMKENIVFCFLLFTNNKFIPQLSKFEQNSLNCLC